MPDLVRKGSEDSLSLESAMNLLLELGIERKNIRIFAEGGFHKFMGGILRQEPKPGDPIDSHSEVILSISQGGLFDILPEGIFSSWGLFDTKEEEVESEIRNFLATFDSLHFQTSSSLEHQKAVSDLVFQNESLTKSFLRFFGFSTQGWDSEDSIIWRILLPTAPAWIGTKTGIERAVKAFLGVDAGLVENIPHANEFPQEFQNRLGKRASSLGQDCVLGEIFEEKDSTFLLQLGPIPINDLPDFRPGGKKREKLERILAHVIPGNTTCEILLVLEEKDRKFVLEQNPGYNLLGYSTVLT